MEETTKTQGFDFENVDMSNAFDFDSIMDDMLESNDESVRKIFNSLNNDSGGMVMDEVGIKTCALLEKIINAAPEPIQMLVIKGALIKLLGGLPKSEHTIGGYVRKLVSEGKIGKIGKQKYASVAIANAENAKGVTKQAPAQEAEVAQYTVEPAQESVADQAIDPLMQFLNK